MAPSRAVLLLLALALNSTWPGVPVRGQLTTEALNKTAAEKWTPPPQPLSFPSELPGWTALHEASRSGNASAIQQALLVRPGLPGGGSSQPPPPRAAAAAAPGPRALGVAARCVSARRRLASRPHTLFRAPPLR